MKDTRTKHLRKVAGWTFMICAAAAAVLMCINGHFAYACWPIIAALFYWTTDTFETLSEDAIGYGGAMTAENLELSSKLCDAEIKILELQEEINRLRDELKK